ncbi:glycosyltransferase, partial [uncultured Nostoc sp.]|uniref:glycosyltransferase n=1 Tax=uncultured Nostoc sp. TaxID=340711 RepID=UPI0035C973BC
MPRVTVIIPSYNHEKFVGEAIQSVLNQTYQDFELVITDDGSTDKTVEIIKSFTDTRIRLFCFERNQGACVAANKCISEAKGEFIAMLSSDDIFAPEKLEKQVNFLDKNPEIGAVFGFAEIIDEYGNDFQDENHFYKHIFIQPNRTRFEWLNYFFFRLNCLCHPSVLIRKKCYDHIGSYDERFAQLPDLDFWIRLCLKYEIYIIPENLIKFRVLQNETNASGDKPTKHIRQSLEITQILKNYLKIEVNDNFLKIFPDILIDITSLETELAPFYVAMLALQVGNPAYKFFAIDTLYQIFTKKNIVIKIKEKYSFEFSNLIILTG